MKSRKVLLIQVALIIFSVIMGAILLIAFPSSTTKAGYITFTVFTQLITLLFSVLLLSSLKNSAKDSTQELLTSNQQKIHLTQELSTLNQQLSSISEQATKLTRYLGKERILRSMLEFCINTIGCDAGFLLTYDYKTETFNYAVGSNMDQTMLIGTKFSPRSGAIREMSQNKAIIVIDDVQTVEKSGQGWLVPEKTSYIKNSTKFVSLPLIVEEQLTGIVGLYCPEESVGFIEHNPRLLNIMKDQLSMCLVSAMQSEYANLDRLTMLYNHEYFKTRLEEEILRCKRYKSDVGLLMIDIDHFKSINDKYGHQIGDLVLKQLASIIKNRVRIVDLCGRYGGEEFVVLLPETNIQGAIIAGERLHETITMGDGANVVAEHLRKMVQEYTFKTDGIQFKVTVSIGIGAWKFKEDADKGSEYLIKQADEQLYRAKNTGRNKVCYPES